MLSKLPIDSIINLLLGSGLLLILLKGVFKIGEFNNRFNNLEKDVETLKNDFGDLRNLRKEFLEFKVEILEILDKRLPNKTTTP